MRNLIANLRRRERSTPPPPDGHFGVAGKTVAVAGDLTEWSNRQDIRAAIVNAGGRYSGVISNRVDVVVLGSPADDDNAAAATLRTARKMANAGRSISIIDEAEFIALIGYPNPGPDDPLRRSPAWAADARGWGPPVDCVYDTGWHFDEFVRLLGPRRVGGYIEPREVLLFRHELHPARVEVVVACRGMVLGMLAVDAAGRLVPAMDAAGVSDVEVPAVLYGGAVGEQDGFAVGLWPERAAVSDEVAAALVELGQRVEPWPPHWHQAS